MIIHICETDQMSSDLRFGIITPVLPLKKEARNFQYRQFIRGDFRRIARALHKQNYGLESVRRFDAEYPGEDICKILR